MTIRQSLSQYQYNFTHTDQTQETLNSLISDPANIYFTTLDYKRRVPQCSKHWIRSKLKEAGYRYKKVRRQRKVERKR